EEDLVARADQRIRRVEAAVLGDALDLKHEWRTRRKGHAPDRAVLEDVAELAARDAAYDAAVGQILEIGRIHAGGPLRHGIEAGPLHAIRIGEKAAEHNEAADHRDVTRLRGRTSKVGEGRGRREVEDLRRDVRLHRDDEVVELSELPI